MKRGALHLWNGSEAIDIKRMQMEGKVKKLNIFDVISWPSIFDASYKAMKERYAAELNTLLQLTNENPEESYRLALHYIEQMDASPKRHPEMPAPEQLISDVDFAKRPNQ